MATIKLKRSTVAGSVPTFQDIDVGEIALNTEDGYLFALKGDASTVQQIGTIASRVDYTAPGSGAVARNAQLWIQEAGVSVKDYGAVGNGVVDDTGAINLAIAHLSSIGGGTLYFPQGTYKVTSEILINSPSIKLQGTGKRGVNPGVFVPGVNVTSTIMPVHSGRCAFRFYAEVEGLINPFSASDINFATLETGAMPQCAFGWDCSDQAKSQNSFTFNSCGFYGFQTVFDLYGTYDPIEMRSLKIYNCNINRNECIAFTDLNTHWSSFIFRDNEAGYNGTQSYHAGINISADACVIEDNRFETMNNPIKVFTASKGSRIAGNYFSANTGLSCIYLQDITRFNVGPNIYMDLNESTLDHKVLLSNCSMGACTDPYWSDLVHKVSLPLLGSSTSVDRLNPLADTQTLAYCRVDKPESFGFMRQPDYLNMVTFPVTIHQREIDPITGQLMPVQEFTTGANDSLSLDYTIVGLAGQWVVLTWLMKQQPGAAVAEPLITLTVTGNTLDAPKTYSLIGYEQHWSAGEWALITCSYKLLGAMSAINATIKPHGANPASGSVSRFLRPVVYTVDDINKVTPYVDSWVAKSNVDAPSAGTWRQGDTLMNSEPTDGLSGSFVCIQSGTPGEWVYT